MYGHQTMQRNTSGGQLSSMMPHPGMMMTSSQAQMMNQVLLSLPFFFNEIAVLCYFIY